MQNNANRSRGGGKNAKFNKNRKSNKFSGKRKGNSRSRRNNRGGRGGRGGRSQKTIDRKLFISKPQQEQSETTDYEGKSYSDYNLQTKLAENLASKGFETTTEIQEKAIPMILQGHDVLGISETGSGKTGAFLISMIEKMLTDGSQKLLIVAPTRELAMQIRKEAVMFIKGTDINISLIIGGEGMNKQISQLKKGDDIVVGTPGRINDMIKRKLIKPDHFNNIIIDEVDRMLDMGFIRDIKFIFSKIADPKQALFFSATHNKQVEKTVQSMSGSFEIIKLAGNTPNKNVVQSVIDYTHRDEKVDLLNDILKQEEVAKAIVFVETKRYADKIMKVLSRKGFKVGAIHGDKRQNARKKIINMFRDSKIDFLVATNVAARGIDIDDITHVINLDEPMSYDEYIHRIGRTGRNGELGTAYTFVERKKGRR